MNEISPVTYIAACSISDDKVYVAALVDNLVEEYGDDISYTRLFIYDHAKACGGISGWYYHDVNFSVVSVCFSESEQQRRVFSLGHEGEIEEYDGENSKYTFINGSGLNAEWSQERGYLTTIKNIGNAVVACGYDAQIYKKDPLWEDFSNHLLSFSTNRITVENIDQLNIDYSENDISVIDICSRNEGEFLCVGRIGSSGMIASYIDGKWQLLPRATLETLYAALTLDNKNILVCGRSGNLLEIDQNYHIKKWEFDISEDFCSLCEFKGKVYIGSSSGLYQFNNGVIEKLNINPYVDQSSIFKVESTENILWIFLEKVFLRFDGKTWQTICTPDNEKDENNPMSVKAGMLCPTSGYWFSFAQNNARQYFKQGDVFPNFESDWGDIYWQFDAVL